MTIPRLAATREPTGYFTADGQLVLDTVGYSLLVRCAYCGQARQCGWYTGHGHTIRWFCDDCAEMPSGALSWAVYDPDTAPKRQMIAPMKLQQGAAMKFWMVYVESGGAPAARHQSEANARTEAERLAKLYTGKHVYVLEAIADCAINAMAWQNYPVSDLPF